MGVPPPAPLPPLLRRLLRLPAVDAAVAEAVPPAPVRRLARNPYGSSGVSGERVCGEGIDQGPL